MEGKVSLQKNHIKIEWATTDSKLWDNILNAVRSLPDRKYHPRPAPHWRVPASSYHASECIRALEPLGFTIQKKIRELAEGLQEVVDAHKATSSRKIKGLYPYQVAAVDFITTAGGRCIIGDDVGLGKTVEALAWAEETRASIGRVLVIAPANVIFKWGKEIEKWTKWDHQVVPSSNSELSPVYCHIMSYDIMRRKLPELLSVGYHLTILDEFHYIKNPKAQRTRSVKVLCENTPYILGLSGTPLLNRPIELFTMLNMLDPIAWSSWWTYGNRYCGGKTEYGMFRGATNRDELAQRLKTIMIRRMKREVRADMPPLTVSTLPIDVDLSEYSDVAQNVQEAILKLSPDSKGYWINVLDKFNLLRQSVGQAKLPIVLTWCKEFLENSDPHVKLLVYAHHKDVVRKLHNILHDRYGCLTIVGDVPAKKREERATAFRQDREHRVMVISQAGGVGQDLFGEVGNDISNILFAELEWRPADAEQAWGRLDRQGQELPVTAHIMQARSTIDLYIARRLAEKERVIEDIIGGSPGIIREIVHDWQQSS